ncbi:MAG: substrate-binding domain-containing protein [Planctomycetia bacterium]|nr:substrate-binding domain-containing protein [Planctomycetia bacterium]
MVSKLHIECPRVAVILDLSVGSARDLLRGILQYLRTNGPWNLNYVSKAVGIIDPSNLLTWEGDGVIAHVPSPDVFEQIRSKNCPFILLSEEEYSLSKDLSGHFVKCDNPEIGKLSARHLLQQGFKHFAYIPHLEPFTWCAEREKAFVESLEAEGKKCLIFPAKKAGETDWFSQRERMCSWLKDLPKPVGILAANDFRGRQILEACQRCGIPVPYQAGVLGVNDDQLVCEMNYPSLSSIAVNWSEGGYKAAELLDRIMSGEPLPKDPYFYGNPRIVSRNSTEKIQTSDELAIRILELIRINEAAQLRVADIVHCLNVSQRSAETRFKKATGHSIIEEIKRERMRKIRSMLEETDHSVNEIARISGFENANYLGKIFKEEFGLTLGEYRKALKISAFPDS